MEAWVDLGYPGMHQPGVELAIDRKSNALTTAPPSRHMTITIQGEPVMET